MVTGCDGYIEQITVGSDGDASFAARGTIACAIDVQTEIWGDAPCDIIDRVSRGGIVADLPFGVVLDQTRTGIVAEGEQDRRRVDATWEGTVDGIGTLLVASAELRTIDSSTFELTVNPAGSPADAVLNDARFAAGLDDAGWPPAEFRVVAPEVITEHNADRINGRTVTWFYDADRPEILRVRWTTDGPPIRIWWWIVGGAVLAVVLFMIVSLEGSRDRNDHRN
jgi:hypothetical protein